MRSRLIGKTDPIREWWGHTSLAYSVTKHSIWQASSFIWLLSIERGQLKRNWDNKNEMKSLSLDWLQIYGVLTAKHLEHTACKGKPSEQSTATTVNPTLHKLQNHFFGLYRKTCTQSLSVGIPAVTWHHYGKVMTPKRDIVNALAIIMLILLSHKSSVFAINPDGTEFSTIEKGLLARRSSDFQANCRR